MLQAIPTNMNMGVSFDNTIHTISFISPSYMLQAIPNMNFNNAAFVGDQMAPGNIAVANQVIVNENYVSIFS